MMTISYGLSSGDLYVIYAEDDRRKGIFFIYLMIFDPVNNVVRE